MRRWSRRPSEPVSLPEMLRQLRGFEEPFGRISVLLVGDHGQLPPVKDKRCYDWSGCRKTTALHGAPASVSDDEEDDEDFSF